MESRAAFFILAIQELPPLHVAQVAKSVWISSNPGEAYETLAA
jgi:hypothetical protein